MGGRLQGLEQGLFRPDKLSTTSSLVFQWGIWTLLRSNCFLNLRSTKQKTRDLNPDPTFLFFLSSFDPSCPIGSHPLTPISTCSSPAWWERHVSESLRPQLRLFTLFFQLSVYEQAHNQFRLPVWKVGHLQTGEIGDLKWKKETI